MTEREIQQRRDNVKEAYRMLKDHPYWETLDRALLKDVLKLFGTISRNYWGTADNTNPYYAIIRCVTHDFNCMLGNLSDSIRLASFEERWGEYMDTVNMVLKTYMENVGHMIDNDEPDGDVVGYTFLKSNGLSKLQAFKGESIYKVLCIVDTQEKYNTVKKYLEKHADPNKARGPIQEWAAKSLQELNEGKDEVGECWKITLK